MFSSQSGNVRHKNKLEVTLRVVGEDPLDAVVFLRPDERLVDLLNDERAFLPVQRQGGQTIILAKDQIVMITENHWSRGGGADSDPSGSADADADGHADAAGGRTGSAASDAFDPTGLDPDSPYAILRVSPEASAQQVKAAYRARIKAVHPDALASQGVDAELVAAASAVVQKVNEAYQEIMASRGADDTGGPSGS